MDHSLATLKPPTRTYDSHRFQEVASDPDPSAQPLKTGLDTMPTPKNQNDPGFVDLGQGQIKLIMPSKSLCGSYDSLSSRKDSYPLSPSTPSSTVSCIDQFMTVMPSWTLITWLACILCLVAAIYVDL
ncbi:hypothetical protein BDP27DRAFT_1429432 [Rhodocollybia butyracea]|uniref:Uncharacterized protein n=1 Tax=Rhodocollybia butyracea TaxID=206335 RepID=A0A9P5U0Y3_9AGAR|nr:hypothetical protein BDP27DRAFT_1429432 [Rhodocollybia butyracea]